MSRRYLPNDVEAQLCKIFYKDFCKVYPKYIPYLTHLPFGEQRNAGVGKKLKDMGCTRGWPDYGFFWPCSGYHSLFLEFKTNKGKVSEWQYTRMNVLRGAGFACAVVRGSTIAIEVIGLYLEGKYFSAPNFEYKKPRLKNRETDRETSPVRAGKENL